MEHSGLQVNADVRLNRPTKRSFLFSPLILEVYFDRYFCRVPSLVFLVRDQMTKIMPRVT